MPLFAAHAARRLRFAVTTITIAEVLAGPLQSNDQAPARCCGGPPSPRVNPPKLHPRHQARRPLHPTPLLATYRRIIIFRYCTEGGLNGPPFLLAEAQTERLEARIAAIVEPTLTDMGYELVRVAISGREDLTVQIMADRTDGTPITIQDCEDISYALGAVLDVEDPIRSAWNLEISSPGIDRPLTRPKDWNRFAGHLARAETTYPIAGRRRFSGIALGADEQAARLRLDDGSEVMLPLADIRRAKLVLTEALIAATAQHKAN